MYAVYFYCLASLATFLDQSTSLSLDFQQDSEVKLIPNLIAHIIKIAHLSTHGRSSRLRYLQS